MRSRRSFSEGREADTPFFPDLPPSWFTVEGQRERIEAAAHLYGIFEERELAGTIALSNVVRGPFQSATVGYWIAAPRRGRRLATGAVAAIVDVAFGELGLHRLEAATLLDNVASQRVLEKNDFTLIGTARRYLRIAGAWRDHLLYQRTADE